MIRFLCCLITSSIHALFDSSFIIGVYLYYLISNLLNSKQSIDYCVK